MAFNTEAKVGVFVIAGLVLLAVMTIQIGDLKFGEEKGYSVYAVFDTASGLKIKAPVEMAGIAIGRVTGISLEAGRAKVAMEIDPRVKLAADSVVSISTRGVLGDKFITVSAGSPAAPLLANGGKLVKTRMPTDVDEVIQSIGQVADNIKVITDSLKVSVASQESQANITETLANLKELTASLKVVVADNQSRLNNIVDNMERFTGDLSEITAANKEALSQTIRNFQAASNQMSTTLSGLNSVIEKVDRGEGTIGKLVNDGQTIDDLNKTLASLKEITDKINKGEGSLGKLVNDDTTVNKIDEALTGINDYLDQGDAWKLALEYRAEYMFEEEGARSILNVRLQPKADKFYLLGIVTDPVGERQETITHRNTYIDGTLIETTDRQVKYDKDQIRFNAQFGKRFRDLTFRAGLFQSTGGVGLDYYLWDDQVRLSAEVFEFGSGSDPHIKGYIDYNFWNHFLVTAGVENYTNADDENATSFFLGMGFYFGDDDLKFLMSNAP